MSDEQRVAITELDRAIAELLEVAHGDPGDLQRYILGNVTAITTDEDAEWDRNRLFDDPQDEDDDE